MHLFDTDVTTTMPTCDSDAVFQMLHVTQLAIKMAFGWEINCHGLPLQLQPRFLIA